MTNYIAKAAAVKVNVGPKSGNTVAVILRSGDIVPEGVDVELLDSLESRGLIEALDEAAPEEAANEPTSLDDFTVAELDAEIEKRNEGREDADKVLPEAPGNKPEKVAALKADDEKKAAASAA